MRHKPELWVHYNQVIGFWGWRISDGNMVTWSRDQFQTEYEAIRAAEDRFEEYFPGLGIPAPRIFRTAREYANASYSKRRR